MNVRRATVRPLAAALALAVLAACSSPTGTVTVTGGTTAPSSNATPTAAATPEPPVDGALPVPALPASAIPWDELGPGWFLLTNDPDASDDVWPQSDGIGRFPVMDEAVQLVSPSGDLYYVRDLSDVGNGRPVEWLGDALTILDGEFYAESDDIPHGRLLSLDLRSGATHVVNPAAYDADFLRSLPDGRMVSQWGPEGTLLVEVVKPDLTVDATICEGDGTATSLAPDNSRVVCLKPNAGGGTDVMLYTIGGGAGAKIDTFKYDPWRYYTWGWWDKDRFLLSRWTDDGMEELFWTYNVVTKKVAEVTPRLSDGTVATTYGGAGGYRIVSTEAAAEVQGFDGTLLATLPCAPATFSGHTALSLCWDWEAGPMTIAIANLDTGTVTTIADFTAGDDQYVRIFPYPGGESASLR